MTTPVDTASNDAQRARLIALVAQLSDEDLARPRPEGEWTVADTLGHLAFYDRRAQVLLEKYLPEGVSPAPSDVQTINDALLPLLRRTSPRALAEEAVSAAEAADAAATRVSPDLLAEIARRNEAVPDRWRHRKAHLDYLAQALA